MRIKICDEEIDTEAYSVEIVSSPASKDYVLLGITHGGSFRVYMPTYNKQRGSFTWYSLGTVDGPVLRNLMSVFKLCAHSTYGGLGWLEMFAIIPRSTYNMILKQSGV